MTLGQQRSAEAWRLVNLGGLTGPQIVQQSGVSLRLVEKMRAAIRAGHTKWPVQ